MKNIRMSKFTGEKKPGLLHTPQPKSLLLHSILLRTAAGAVGGQPTNAFERALEEFAMCGGPLGSPVPDYHGFRNWFADLAKGDPAAQLVFTRGSGHTESTASTALGLAEMRALRQRYVQALQEYKGDAGIEQLRIYNKLKLLTSILDGSARASEFSAALEKGVPEELDQAWSSCTQADLRLRLFAAIQRKEWRTAFKIIGRLKEESHDVGELDFLEALARFHSDDLEGCISYASRVTKDHIDFNAARALQLECLAYRGSVTKLLNLLESLGPSTISPMFMRYLGQVLALNAQDPAQAVQDLNERATASGWKLNTVPIKSDPFFTAFNRHSCSVALRLAEWLDARDVAEKLVVDETPDAAEVIDPHCNRLATALHAFDPELAIALAKAPAGGASIPIVQRLLNVPYEKQLADYAQALEAQLRLGATESFIDNLARLVAALDGRHVPQALMSLAQAAYVEAASRKLPVENQLAAALRASGIDCGASLADRVQRSQRIDVLSPMGKLSYAWAEAALEGAEQADIFHQDAGMIALGFFRILENELNALLIEPFRNSESMRTEVEELWSRLGTHLATEDVSLPKNGAAKRKKAYELWSQMIERLGPVLKGERTGLELGPLHILLEKCRSTSGEDVELKQYFASKLTSHLNDAGRTAFAKGAIAKFIEQSAVERYRNPPAHSRFVSLATARACKCHVDQCISGLTEWVDLPRQASDNAVTAPAAVGG